MSEWRLIFTYKYAGDDNSGGGRRCRRMVVNGSDISHEVYGHDATGGVAWLPELVLDLPRLTIGVLLAHTHSHLPSPHIRPQDYVRFDLPKPVELAA